MPSTAIARANTFAELQIDPRLRHALGGRGIAIPTPIQAEVIPLLLEGKDVIGQARTGSGKTLAFALPLLERCDPVRSGVQALVQVPTRELAIQVGEVIGHLAGVKRLRHTLLYGGRSLGAEQRLLPSAQIVIGTPGRTLDHLRQGSLSLKHLRMLVLDEADEMLDRGFAPDVERIIGYAPVQRQTALFSATVPAWVAGAARAYMRAPVSVSVDPGATSPPEIEHLVYDVEASAKMGALTTLLDRRGDGPIIVFGRTKHGVKNLAQKLVRMGYPSAALQGNLSQNARERVMSDFRAGRVPILLATNVAARGLDVQDVECVINYELPESAEWITHRVGRTGRMGRSGQAITLLTAEDAGKWRQFERSLGRKFRRAAWAGSDTPTASAHEEVSGVRSETIARSARPLAERLVNPSVAATPARGGAQSRPSGKGARRPPTRDGQRRSSPRQGDVAAPPPRQAEVARPARRRPRKTWFRAARGAAA